MTRESTIVTVELFHPVGQSENAVKAFNVAIDLLTVGGDFGNVAVGEAIPIGTVHNLICTGCGHIVHDDEFCSGFSECDEPCRVHECTCSGPGGENYPRVPRRPISVWLERRKLKRDDRKESR